MFGSIARRLTFAAAVIALALAPVAASAQLLLGVSQPAAGGGGGGYVGPGDIVSGATFWVGLRAYSTATAAANAKAILVVRASDGQSCDVLLAATGGLGNTASCSGGFGTNPIATFCAATTCAIDKFYDQIGGTAMWVANTSATRATLSFSCIGALVCADFAGTSWYSGSNAALTQPPGFTTSLVAIQSGSLTVQNNLLDVGSGSFFTQTAGVQKVGGYWGNTGTATQTNGVWHAVQIVTNTTSSAVAVDATQTTGLSMGSNSQPASSFLGSQNSGGTGAFNGKITEIGMWPVAFTGTQMTNLCHNQFTYWGTPTSC